MSSIPAHIRIAFVTSHPIQYQVPVFRDLAGRSGLELEVLFAQIPDAQSQGAGFGVGFEWDIPLLDGYQYQVLKNVSAKPSVTCYAGCDTPGIGKVLREGRFDVVVVNGWVVKSCLQTLAACLRQRVPCLVRGEANDLRPRASWKRVIQRLLVNRFDAVLPIGTANRRFYADRGVAESRMFNAPYCVENRRFELTAEERSNRWKHRERFGLSPSAVVVLYCGKFEPKKHPLELLQAAAASRAQGAQFELLMVGDGPLRKQCEALVSQHDLVVRFPGFLNQGSIGQAYAAADLLVLPSDHGETWGLVVNEAFASSVPAVVSDQVGCGEDLIVPGKTGELFPFGDWQALAEVLGRLTADPKQLAEMGAKARCHIDQFSPSKAADGIEQGARWAAAKRPRRK